MNRKKWTKDEEIMLIKEFPIRTNKELSEMFNRSEKSIIQHAHTLKLYKNRQVLWEEYEIEFLKKHYNVDMVPSEIAKTLKRSVGSIKSKAFAIGLADHVEWTQKQIDYLIDNYCYKTNEEIGAKIGKSGQAVSYKAFELSLSINENWTNDEINIIKTNYLNKTMSELQQLLQGRTKGDILACCHKLGLTRLKKTCVRDFFNIIDTEEKAYWLGFMFANGYISFSEANLKKGQIATAYCVGIKLQVSDKDHLKKFNKSINGNYKVFEETIHPDGFRKQKTKSAKILVYSKQMYDDLNKYFERDKTYTAIFPNISEDLIETEFINLRAKEKIVIEDRDSEKWVYLYEFYKAELNTAEKLLILKNSKNIKHISKIDKELKILENKSDIILSEKQIEAIKQINDNNVCVITGGPGTGKTTIIKTVLDLYKKQGKKA